MVVVVIPPETFYFSGSVPFTFSFLSKLPSFVHHGYFFFCFARHYAKDLEEPNGLKIHSHGAQVLYSSTSTIRFHLRMVGVVYTLKGIDRFPPPLFSLFSHFPWLAGAEKCYEYY
ncbi:unnamed protein product [Tuber melanosporum]|uniref:(Perigord truffle) hypothetical protein n=1 Tax=Tuber melanosporum (strain Mel28) TaxID=656061 RepID=D5G716_TUBMM|nr:uncharacterized protein GSTUM_00004554001 [Tuber melanosporum]CAZ80309.1 unnamed protein product [Tuber melanosporum]